VHVSSHWWRSVCLALIALHLLAQEAPTPKRGTETSPAAEDADAKRTQAYRVLDALDTAIKAASRTGVDTARLTTQAQELRLQLHRAVDDAETAEVTTKAADLMDELAKRDARQVRPAPTSQKRAATPPPAVVTPPISYPTPSAPEEQPTSHLPLILSGIAVLFSLAAIVIAPILCKSAIEKALRSAGLQ
jgi:hypothetical protein